MIVSILETINEFEPFGRLLMPLHPKHNGLLPLNNISFWTSAETDPSRDLFRALKAVTVEDNTSVNAFTVAIFANNISKTLFVFREKTGD
jgi:hypothetical protein